MATRSNNKRRAVDWLDLPLELTESIMSRVDQAEILTSVQFVCSKWLHICRAPHMWRSIVLRCPVKSLHKSSPSTYKSEMALCRSYQKLCRQALYYASSLTDIRITIERFFDDRMLIYLSDRYGPQIKSLRITYCLAEFSEEASVKALAKFPNLQELDIELGFMHSSGVIAIGTCCPNLTTFKYTCFRRLYHHSEIELCNKVACAIAVYFPNLRHLALVSNSITDHGLRAILKGCRNLSSLDLLLCLHLDMKGGLLRRCRRRLKHLRLPLDGVCDMANREFRPSTERWCDPCSVYNFLKRKKPQLLSPQYHGESGCTCLKTWSTWDEDILLHYPEWES